MAAPASPAPRTPRSASSKSPRTTAFQPASSTRSFWMWRRIAVCRAFISCKRWAPIALLGSSTASAPTASASWSEALCLPTSMSALFAPALKLRARISGSPTPSWTRLSQSSRRRYSLTMLLSAAPTLRTTSCPFIPRLTWARSQGHQAHKRAILSPGASHSVNFPAPRSPVFASIFIGTFPARSLNLTNPHFIRA